MKGTEIIGRINKSLNRAGLKLKKHSPEILIVAGVAGAVASAVMACKATTKVSGILERSKEHVDTIHGYLEKPDKKEEYTEEDSKKDLLIVYRNTAVNLGKLYAPSVLLGIASITCILASNNIIHKRNVALTSALTVAEQRYKDYRGRVVERFGQEVDHQLRYNIKAREIKETVIDENGEEKTVTKTVDVADPNTYSDYSRFFDEGCSGWEKDPEYNLMFLRAQQQYANDILRSRGHLFLNEVYDMLGIPRTKAGQVVGWVYDEDNAVGDNFVDFGIYDIYREKNRDFVNGYEPVILLDFNVDGNILELI